MLTLFTIPKPFAGHIGVIQRNAVRSWARLRGPDGRPCQLVLCGGEAGTAEMAEEVGATHVAELACSDYGTPRLDDAFARVNRISDRPMCGYVNADILLPDALLDAASRLASLDDFLAVTRRWTVDVDRELDFEPGWDRELREGVAAPDRPHSIDFFLFPTAGEMGELPPFLVGRPGWDNWMIFESWRRGLPSVDLSDAVAILHQRHGYGHVPAGRGSRWEGPEADANRRLLGSRFRVFDISHATHAMTPDGRVVERAEAKSPRLERRLQYAFARRPRATLPLRLVTWPLRFAWRVGRSRYGWVSGPRRARADAQRRSYGPRKLDR